MLECDEASVDYLALLYRDAVDVRYFMQGLSKNGICDFVASIAKFTTRRDGSARTHAS